jgi:quercetin dioxygenase-like cupin family protein
MGIDRRKVRQEVNEVSWAPHAIAEGVTIKPLVTKKEDDTDVTCLLVRIPKGRVIPDHIHEKQDDILYPLAGRATMWVDGTGFFPLEPGCIVRVPKGTLHRIENVTEEVLMYGVFWPALL